MTQEELQRKEVEEVLAKIFNVINGTSLSAAQMATIILTFANELITHIPKCPEMSVYLAGLLEAFANICNRYLNEGAASEINEKFIYNEHTTIQ
jgi:hypothetical protein